MSLRNRRGQAALEFLTTYGWAFLVVLVMIGALAYFGVISPNKFLPERCNFQQEFFCKDFMIDTDETRFVLMNQLGSAVDTLSFDVVFPDSSTAACTVPANIGAGVARAINCTGLSNPALIQGEKVKLKFTGSYKVIGGQYDRPLNGEIFGTVQ